ncbi:hypothetical protein R84B8_00080 [Treponema sp. R8-4-B8]
MDHVLLVNSIYEAATNIDSGRKGFAIEGKEREGRINYEYGIEVAMTAFQEAQASADPQSIILAEYTFLSQELEFLEKSDKDSISSLSKAVRFFDDAFFALKAVESLHYEIAEQTHPHDTKYRVKGFPKDSFHIACSGHKTRIQNILKAPGIDPMEKALLKQRLINMSTAQTAYVEKQKKALTK